MKQRTNKTTMNQITTTDNNCGKPIQDCSNGSAKDIYSDLTNIANYSLKDLTKDNPSLLVFPKDWGKHKDDIDKLKICELAGSSDKPEKAIITTGNLMGFIGYSNTIISITSRFAKGDEDHFLHYMLQKVGLIHLFDYKHTADHDKLFDFLLYLFPTMLKKAVAQGIFKTYQAFRHNDANVKGTIDVPRHIQKNIPFAGRVAYNTRERTFDNPITELIRHTIEHIKTKQNGKSILFSDTETKDAIAAIIQATPTYNLMQREKIITQNIKPLNHPYFTEYKPLQTLCLAILRHQKLKYRNNTKKVYGILFDGAWLWEEYLATILTKCGFTHPRNKDSKGGIRMFATNDAENEFYKNYRRIYPDFYRTAHSNNPMILDAKYKRLQNGVKRDDLYQIVTYMHTMEIQFGGFIFPYETEETLPQKFKGADKEYKLVGYGGEISVIGIPIPQNASSYNNFVEYMKATEEDLKNYIK